MSIAELGLHAHSHCLQLFGELQFDVSGGVVGGVAGAALLALLAFVLVRRRLRQTQKDDADRGAQAEVMDQDQTGFLQV